MTLLNSLKLVTAQQKSPVSPVAHRRHKLSQKLLEQIEMAKAQQSGQRYTSTRTKFKTNEAGERIAVESEKRLTNWWWKAASGKFNLSIRYGAKVIELAKNKNAIEVANLAEVIATLELINQAVLNGELDAALEAVSSTTRKAAK